MSKPENPYAFPSTEHTYTGNGSPAINDYFGMTLRDYFAGQALIGVMNLMAAGKLYSDAPDDATVGDVVAIEAYHYADLMLKERES